MMFQLQHLHKGTLTNEPHLRDPPVGSLAFIFQEQKAKTFRPQLLAQQQFLSQHKSQVFRQQDGQSASPRSRSLIPRCQNFKPWSWCLLSAADQKESLRTTCLVLDFSLVIALREWRICTFCILFAFPGGYSHFARCVGVDIANLCSVYTCTDTAAYGRLVTVRSYLGLGF